MIDDRIDLLLHFTDIAAKRVNDLTEDKGNKNLKLRIYIIGGGCSGFQYGFILDETVNDGDYCVEKNGAILIVDSLSLQYLIGSIIDYHEEIIGARFVVINPNAKITCSCGSSFNV